jgi:hypothetical protein
MDMQATDGKRRVACELPPLAGFEDDHIVVGAFFGA